DLACYRAHHPGVMRSLTELLPGAREAIMHLHSAGKKLGVCSNKPRVFTQELLSHLGIAAYFQTVLGPEDVPRLKPAPDMLLAAMARLGATPAQTLYIGDMVVDIETARAAQAAVWVVPTGSESTADLQDAKPDRMLGSLRELTILVE
ncbi:MAG: HAD-IA family hydrolase, partial [Gemmataceae bacterium]|nr:HAD-IA family hydrolase [Gemmataceae bacterium]